MKKPQLYHIPVDGAEEPLSPPEVQPAVTPKAPSEAFAVTPSGEPTSGKLDDETARIYQAQRDLYRPGNAKEYMADLDRTLCEVLKRIVSSGTASAKHLDVARQYLRDKGWTLDKMAARERMADDAVNLTDLDLDFPDDESGYGNA